MALSYPLFAQLLFAISWEITTASTAGFSSELLGEWEGWKNQHGKSYVHRREELERHIIWASYRKYIEEHNANSDTFGYTLAMNQFGDLVHDMQTACLQWQR